MKPVLLVVSQFFFFGLSLAFAHSNFVRSEPAGGATLAQSPNEIRIWFSEPIKVALSVVEVRNLNGDQVDQKDLRADGKVSNLVRLTLSPKLAPGSYKVSWSAVAQDLHVTRGSYVFKVGR